MGMPEPQEFEIRIVIWEVENVPIPTGSTTIDLFVKVEQDSYGWTGSMTEKETDTHMGSEDGHGIFNWRMKFSLEIPCPFPRLKFLIYDFNAFSSSDAIGTCVISFMKLFPKLKSEGKYQTNFKILKLMHPNFPGESRGELKVSIHIITKQEANASPVGEAQEDPNRDPYLTKPKEGRGIADFFKGTSLDFGLWKIILKRVLIVVLGLLGSALVTLILFVQPGILVNGSK
eukprot:TRINITY_DN3002_c0_g1_i1.p3 TRINITY_DN3002_c0_g1~~TRINITY_DN3002_c0_g1_i1.p3  ORF type:complete len:230 (-),score=39.42 TRINITY_DN3002_c0_g1_i1:180-869(-)